MDLGVVGEVGNEPDQLQTFPVKAIPGFLQGDMDDPGACRLLHPRPLSVTCSQDA